MRHQAEGLARPGGTQEDGVSEFGGLEKKAECYDEEHPP
jgi:hypothetical protein